MITQARILELLDYVKDPEIPVINVLELGVVRGVEVEESGKAIITITPTYTGCPAMDVMAADIIGLADALVYSRQMHITHRFINPSNVLISGMDGAKLTNWRVAAVTDKLSLSRSDGEKEFLAYSAPEQVDARLGGSDWSTDVYQFGMLLYHMLARRLPSAGSGEDNPPASGIITTGVSEPLDHLVIKCLARNKNDRYRDMRSLKAELEQAIAACNDAG